MDDQRFDDLAKRLAAGSFSRRRVLRGLGSGLTGIALAATLPPLAGGAQGNSDCAHFCQTVFPPGPDRGQCVSEAAQGGGLCYQCGPAATGSSFALCGRTCVQLGTDDNCGGCGDVCISPQTCGGGTPGVCGCTPEDPVTLCAGTCGSVTNKCGQPISCTDLCEGCCTGENVCELGTDNGACGTEGTTCEVCADSAACCGGSCKGAANTFCTANADCCSGECYDTDYCCPVCPPGCSCDEPAEFNGLVCTTGGGSFTPCSGSDECPSGEYCSDIMVHCMKLC